MRVPPAGRFHSWPRLTAWLRCGGVVAGCILALALPDMQAAVPPELAAAMRNLREQHSYSWEIINGDPGPVAQNIETKRGKIKTVQHNTAPHVRGRLSATGEMFLECEWPDGLAMQALVGADGARVTHTPEGWLSRQEILERITAERMRSDGPSDRMQWLQLADALDTRRPDQELAPMVDDRWDFAMTGETFVGRFRISGGDRDAGDDGAPSMGEIVASIHVSAGVLRDYEIQSEIKRYVSQARIPLVINGDRIVILTYLPVGRINVPDEARAKLKSGRPASGG